MLHISTIANKNASRYRNLRSGIGTSFLVDYNESRILFNTGADDSFIDNAKLLNLDLSKTEAVVLSDNQYETAEGYRFFLTMQNTPGILFMPYRFFENYYTRQGFTYTSRSSRLKAHQIKDKMISVQNVGDTLNLRRGINLHTSSFKENANGDFDLLISYNGQFSIDRKYEELYLVADTASGLVIITGTAITGLVNIVDEVARIYRRPICAVFGDFAIDLDKARTEQNKAKLHDYGIKTIVCNLNAEKENYVIGKTLISNLAVGDEFFF